MKNNKGFTLIEVIAVVVILGIVALVAVPRIYSLITESRRSLYVEDSRRLIAQAQYKMSANSVNIIKPNNGEYIVLSLKYLDVTGFQNPPNGGSYLPEASFVTVKNHGGNFEYSAMLVEYTKDGVYYGMELTSEEEIASKNAVSHVREFVFESEVVFVDEDSAFQNHGNALDSTYISNHLDNTIDSEDIIGVYNDTQLDTEIEVVDSSSPKISVRIDTDVANINTIHAVLNVRATDTDSDDALLTVCTKVSTSKTEEYATSGNAYCSQYGTGYSKDINFADYGLSYLVGGDAYIYVYVRDPDGNFSRKMVSYSLYKNLPPTIHNFTITSTINSGNSSKVNVRLDVSDDLESYDNLDVCILEDSSDASSCVYRHYSELFRNKLMSYTFHSGGNEIIIPDGSSHTLNVYVVDNLGLVGTSSASYTISNNAPPTLSMELVSHKFNTRTDKNKLNVNLSVVTSETGDDLSSNSKLRIRIGDYEDSLENFLTRKNNNYAYEFDTDLPGRYNGQPRSITITLTDEYGASTSVVKTLDNVLNYEGPTLNSVILNSNGSPCPDTGNCSGNASSAWVSFNYTDPLYNDVVSGEPSGSPNNHFKVCISESSSGCSSTSGNFRNYSDVVSTAYDFSGGLDLPYLGTSKTLYAMFYNLDYGYYSNLVHANYQLYNNVGPTITGNISISSTDAIIHYNTVNINLNGLNIVDDIDNSDTFQTALCYYKQGESSRDAICTDYSSFGALKNSLSVMPFTIDMGGEDYSGQVYKFFVKAKDSYSIIQTSNEATYTLYNKATDDLPPEIITATLRVESYETFYNSYRFSLYFDVKDVLDFYTICVSESASSCDYSYFTTVYDGNNFGSQKMIIVDGSRVLGWPTDYIYSEAGSNRKNLYFHVLDQNGGHESVARINDPTYAYEVYSACLNASDIVEYDDGVYEPSTSTDEVTTSACSGKCYRNPGITTTLSYLNQNTFSGTYTKTITYKDRIVNTVCSTQTLTDEKYCNYVDCFNYSESNALYIGLNKINSDKVWTVTLTDVEPTSNDNPLCTNISLPHYFDEDDYRCSQLSTFCETQALLKYPSLCEPVSYDGFDFNATANSYASLNQFSPYTNIPPIPDANVLSEAPMTPEEINPTEPDYGEHSPYDITCDEGLEEDECQEQEENMFNEWCSDYPELCDQYNYYQAYLLVDTMPEEGSPEYEEWCAENPLSCVWTTRYNQYLIWKAHRDEFVTNYNAWLADRDSNLETYFTWKKNMYDYVAAEYASYVALQDEQHAAQCAMLDAPQIAKRDAFIPVCNQHLTNFCSTPATNSSVYVSVDCATANLEDEDTFARYCDLKLENYCYENEAKTDSDEVITTDSQCDSTSDCVKRCYQRLNCNLNSVVYPTVTCHGEYVIYSTIRTGDTLRLVDSKYRACPDIFEGNIAGVNYFVGNEQFGGYYKFNSGSNNTYILFNPSELAD